MPLLALFLAFYLALAGEESGGGGGCETSHSLSSILSMLCSWMCVLICAAEKATFQIELLLEVS